MTWKDQLLPASFRGVYFEVRAVDFEGGKKGKDHDRPKKNGGSVEDLGNKIDNISIEGYLQGDSYIRERNRLQAALETYGPGELILPTRGSLEALPVSWRITEEVNAEGGFVRFNIEFRIPLFPNIPQIEESPVTNMEAAIDTIIELSAENYVEEVLLDDVGVFERALADLQSGVAAINAQISGVVADVTSAYNELEATITSTMDDVLAANPLTILTNVQQLVSLPSKIANNFNNLKNRYKNIIENTLDVFPFDTLMNSKLAKAQCAHAEMTCGIALASLAQSAVNSDFTTRSGILAANNMITDLMDTYTASLGAYATLFETGQFAEDLGSGRFVPNYDVFSAVSTVISNVSASLINRSFKLPSEVHIVLDKDRTLLDLAFEIYGGVDKVDEIISMNSINDTYLLPSGMEIVYYA